MANSHVARTAGLPRISVISPTFNERANIRPLTVAIGEALDGIDWELVIVDDDSPDGTADEALQMARDGFPVRCIRRIGRRGLSSAVAEGALAASGEILAVIDADMQHDERVLRHMLGLLEQGDVDLVIGSRHIDGGGLGDWSARRARMSRFATWCAQFTLGTAISDPMSGFFALRRETFHACIYDLSQQGYKILLDIVSSSPRALRIVEVPYVFRNRSAGESKIDVMVLAEFAFLLIEKFTRGLVPARFVLFSIVGCIGLLLHLAVLDVARVVGYEFFDAQVIATISAMTLNYFINNSFTYRSTRLKGRRMLYGYVVFCCVCSVGGLANVGVADLVLAGYGSWPLAGVAGALMSAVFNFGAASQFVWNAKRKRRAPIVAVPART